MWDIILAFFGLERKRSLTQDQWVPKIILGCASMELEVNQVVRLNAVDGMYGSVRVSGNSIPTFQYVVFDANLMEFIRMKAHLSLPHFVQFELEVIPTGDGPPEKPIEMKTEYQKPFFTLAKHLCEYFPIPMPEKKAHEVRTIVGEAC